MSQRGRWNNNMCAKMMMRERGREKERKNCYRRGYHWLLGWRKERMNDRGHGSAYEVRL